MLSKQAQAFRGYGRCKGGAASERSCKVYSRRSQIKNLEAASTAQLIAFQRKMGIADVDIRVASNAQIEAFQGQFKDPSLSYNDKSKLGISFITSFGVENEGRVMRNLMSQGVLTLADTWIIANPAMLVALILKLQTVPAL